MKDAAVLCAVVLLTGCSEDALTRVRREGLRVGYAVEAPYAFLSANAQVTGADPELARLVARRLEIANVRFRLTRFADLLEELNAGLIDVVAAGLFVTPEREQRVLFSHPTLHVRASLLVAEGNPLQLHSYSQLATQALQVAVVRGAVEADVLASLGARTVEVPDLLAGQRAVESRAVDALALSEPTLAWVERQGTSAERVRAVEQPAQSPYPATCAAAFRKTDGALRDAWDQALEHLEAGGEAHEVRVRFGFEEPHP